MIIIDTETSGLQPWKHSIIQIAAYDEATGDQWQRKLMFDEAKAEPQALQLNHYDPEVWRTEAIAEDKAKAEFLDFIRHHSPIEKIGKSGKPYKVAQACAYNAQFDKDFIDRWMWDEAAKKRTFLPLEPKWVDPLQICMALFPDLPDHKLTSVARLIGIEVGKSAHDAMADVLILAQIVYKIRPAIRLAADWCTNNLVQAQEVQPDVEPVDEIGNSIPF